MTVVTLDPCVAAATGPDSWPAANRPAALEELTLGVVCNSFYDSETMLDYLGAELVERYQVADVVKVVKANRTVPLKDEKWAAIAEHANVVVTGFAGCGGSATRSLRDVLELEAAGIPAVLLVHEIQLTAVEALRDYLGITRDLPVVVVGFPVTPTAHWSDAESRELAAAIADSVHERLVARSDKPSLAAAA